MPLADLRKEFVISSCAGFFGILSDELSDLQSAKELNSFLDDGNCTVLAARSDSAKGSKSVQFTNKVSDY